MLLHCFNILGYVREEGDKLLSKLGTSVLLEEEGVRCQDADPAYLLFMTEYNDYRITIIPKDDKLKKYFFKINFGAESLASFPYRFVEQVKLYSPLFTCRNIRTNLSYLLVLPIFQV